MSYVIKYILILCVSGVVFVMADNDGPAAFAQNLSLDFNLGEGASQPIEITAESLNLDQAKSTATFVGNVLVKQNQMTLSAQDLMVDYDQEQTALKSIHTDKGIIVILPQQRVTAERAVYDVQKQRITMSGNVVYTQGQTSVSGDELVADLSKKIATMTGRVKTTFVPPQDKVSLP